MNNWNTLPKQVARIGSYLTDPAQKFGQMIGLYEKDPAAFYDRTETGPAGDFGDLWQMPPEMPQTPEEMNAATTERVQAASVTLFGTVLFWALVAGATTAVVIKHVLPAKRAYSARRRRTTARRIVARKTRRRIGARRPRMTFKRARTRVAAVRRGYAIRRRRL
jgi:hypothetical protein